MKKLVCGVGKCDLKTSRMVDGKQVKDKAYGAWKRMLERCYSEKCQEKYPTYKGCTVCEEWLTYSNFKVFYENCYVDGWHLDKDLKVDGNKVYSPEACAFVPRDLNLLLLDRGAMRGDYPQGVCYDKYVGKFKSQCSVGGSVKSLGYYSTSEEASIAYKKFKYNHILDEIKRYRDLYRSNRPLMNLLDVLEQRYTKRLSDLNF